MIVVFYRISGKLEFNWKKSRKAKSTIIPLAAVYQKARPSAPILPRPVTLIKKKLIMLSYTVLLL